MVYVVDCAVCGRKFHTRYKRQVICKKGACRKKREKQINTDSKTKKCSWCGNNVTLGLLTTVEQNGRYYHRGCWLQITNQAEPRKEKLPQFDGGNRVLPPRIRVVHHRGLELRAGIMAHVMMNGNI